MTGEQQAHHVPSVLFVCVKNGGKSQMAAALMRLHAGEAIEAHSAGTHPGSAVNALSAQAVAELGADMSGETPTAVDPDLLRQVDRVVVLGDEAAGEVDDDEVSALEIWRTDEPSHRGIEGLERMRLVRDDIDRRVRTLLAELTDSRPRVLFVCVHNAGRSQMAAGYLSHLAGGRIDVLSAGSAPKDQINPVAVEAMAEAGVKSGLPEELSRELAIQTVYGAASYARSSDEDPGQLRSNVTSPNGTTAAALDVLMGTGRMRELVAEAVEAAAERSRELAKD